MSEETAEEFGRDPVSFRNAFTVGTLFIPGRCQLPHNGMLSVWIKLGERYLHTKDFRVDLTPDSRGTEIAFNQSMIVDTEECYEKCKILLRFSMLMYGHRTYKTLAFENLTLSSNQGNLAKVTQVVVFAGLNDCTLQVCWTSLLLDKARRSPFRLTLPSEVRSPQPTSAGRRGDDSSRTPFSPGAMSVDGQRSVDKIRAGKREPESDNRNPGSGRISTRSSPVQFVECSICAQSAAALTATQHDLHQKKKQISALLKRRAEEKETRRAAKAAVEQHVHTLFRQCELLKSDNAYLLKCLIATKVRL
jgi:hypothetical protein